MQEDMEINHGNGISSSNSSPTSPDYGAGYIEHPVSKFDTLAGVAIKYGVEVADIKKMNALVSDLQMFALKSLHIPTPGRHPPSPSLSDDHEISSYFYRQSSSEEKTILDSFQSLRVVSSIQNKPSKGQSHHLAEVEPTSFPHSNPHRNRHRKTKSLLSNFPDEVCQLNDVTAASNDGKGNEKLCRRRQKSVADFSTATEKTLKDSRSNCESSRKCIDLRLKAAAKSSLSNGAEIPVKPVMDNGEESAMMTNGIGGSARRSSSTANLEEQEKGNSIWPNYSWNDLQALSSAVVVTKSLFDGMPKPVTTRFKASMD